MSGTYHMSLAEYKAYVANRKNGGLDQTTGGQKKRNKYGNKKVVADDGTVIASGKEHKYREQLRLRFRAGEISELAEQVWLYLGPNRRMEIDFVFVEKATGERRYVDAKGYATPNWKTKQAWALELGYVIETV